MFVIKSVFFVLSVPVFDVPNFPTSVYCVYAVYFGIRNGPHGLKKLLHILFHHGATAPSGPAPPHYRGFMITITHTTPGRTPLGEWSARRRDLYLTTHNSHKRQITMPSGGIRTHNPSKRSVADLRLRPRGHWDRQYVTRCCINSWHHEITKVTCCFASLHSHIAPVGHRNRLTG
jgi:hypothetical protein